MSNPEIERMKQKVLDDVRKYVADTKELVRSIQSTALRKFVQDELKDIL